MESKVRINMEIIVRSENKNDYRRVEEITRKAFAYPERIERGGIICFEFGANQCTTGIPKTWCW